MNRSKECISIAKNRNQNQDLNKDVYLKIQRGMIIMSELNLEEPDDFDIPSEVDHEGLDQIKYSEDVVDIDDDVPDMSEDDDVESEPYSKEDGMDCWREQLKSLGVPEESIDDAWYDRYLDYLETEVNEEMEGEDGTEEDSQS